jgi:hypothetical protein
MTDVQRREGRTEATVEETQRADPLETGKAPWTEKASVTAREWALGRLERNGVNLIRVLEYVMVDALNKAYADHADG